MKPLKKMKKKTLIQKDLMTIKSDRSPIIPQRSKFKSILKINQRKLTEKQKQFLSLASEKTSKIIFVSGPAGTAKTYLSILQALNMINEKKVSDLLYIRSAVECSDAKIGFLPGEANEKMTPYIQPLIDKLTELLPRGDIDILLKEERVTGIPVGFLRGLNWNAKVIIADECISGNQYIQTSNGKILLKSLYNKYIKGKNLPLLKTYNEKTMHFENDKILSVTSKGKKKIISVVLGNRNIKCTPEHKFLTEFGWKEARELTPFTPLIANNEQKLQTLDVMNEDQFQVFIGSYLGDGHIMEVGKNRYRLKVIHEERQRQYCQWKADLFHSSLRFIKENGYSKKPAFEFTTKCFSLPSSIPMDCKKSCPKWVIDKLDARGIAIWYMDDGDINKSKNNIRISTCSFDLNSQKLFVKKFKEFGIDCSIGEDKGIDYLYYYLRFNSINSKRLLNLIGPYIHENLDYKTDGLLKSRYIYSNKYLNYRHIICDYIIDKNIEENVYDIEMANNHNFIITSSTRGDSKSCSGIVVHNCQNMTYKELFTLITRIGEFSKVFILGDPEQSDINGKSGFIKMISHFDDEESRENGIHVFRFTEEDIVRSGLTQFIIRKVKKAL